MQNVQGLIAKEGQMDSIAYKTLTNSMLLVKVRQRWRMLSVMLNAASVAHSENEPNFLSYV